LNRPLVILILAVALILLWTLRNRPAHWVAPTESPLASTMETTGVSAKAPTHRQAPPPLEARWNNDQLREAEAALERWQISGGILDQVPADGDLLPREERLRYHRMLRAALLELATGDLPRMQDLVLKLRGGGKLRGQVRPSPGDGLLITTASGMALQVPSAAVWMITQYSDTEKTEEEVGEFEGPATLTVRILELLPAGGVEANRLWQRWLDRGGPAHLARLMEGAGGKDLSDALDRIDSLDRNVHIEMETGTSTGKNPAALESWMAGIRARMRTGIPGEERAAILLGHQEWQKWLDLRGPDLYRSESALAEARQKLQLLLSDVVRASGF